MSSIHLAIEDPGLGVVLAESLPTHKISWQGQALPAGYVPDVIVLDGDGPTPTAPLAPWKNADPKPAVVVVGSSPASEKIAVDLGAGRVTKPVDQDAVVEAIERAGRLRFVGALTLAGALAALKHPAAGTALECAPRILAGARVLDPLALRDALLTRLYEYVEVLPALDELRERRLLTVPEVNFCMKLDGATTIRGAIDTGALDSVSAARLIWALVCLGAVRLTAEPAPGTSPRVLATRRLRAHLAARAGRLERALYHDVLETSTDPEPPEVERAARYLAVRYSPERLVGLDLGTLAPVAEKLWQQALKARATLLSREHRAQYEVWLGQRKVSLQPRRASWEQAAAAEEAFVAGQKALASGDAFRAVSLLAQAARLLPDYPDYESYVAWARVLAEEARKGNVRAAAEREARATEKLLVGRRPWPRALMAIGLLHEASGELELAREAFEEAIDCEPGLQLARRALLRIDAARPRPAAGPGGSPGSS